MIDHLLQSYSIYYDIETCNDRDLVAKAFFLSASENDLIMDPNTFGLLFESLVVRDLRAYARYHEGEVMHYKDSDGLEADAIVHLDDGRWGQ